MKAEAVSLRVGCLFVWWVWLLSFSFGFLVLLSLWQRAIPFQDLGRWQNPHNVCWPGKREGKSKHWYFFSKRGKDVFIPFTVSPGISLATPEAPSPSPSDILLEPLAEATLGKSTSSHNPLRQSDGTWCPALASTNTVFGICTLILVCMHYYTPGTILSNTCIYLCICINIYTYYH